jgi:hypothetical protein
MADFFEGKTVGAINEALCKRYVEGRGKSSSTVRRELGVLNAAVHLAV